MHRANQPMRLETLFPGYYENSWVGHSCKAILDGMQEAGADTQLTVLACGKGSEEPNIHPAVPRKMLRLLGTAPTQALAEAWLKRSFIRRLGPRSVAYFWLSSPLPLIERARERGNFVVREMINCTAAKRRAELDRAHALLGWENPAPVTDEEIERERSELLACDAVFCPNPMVRQSVLDYGVAPEACIDCSYGWSEARFSPHPHQPEPHAGVNVLFVGTIDVRKGTPWLLQAWQKANIDGTLLLSGRIDDELAKRAGAWFDQTNVRHLGHVSDLSTVYDSADVFVFPSWEEGGPMVTLEAMAHGLPCVVTPMGTSGAVTEQEGIIVEPGSVEALAEALVRLSSSAPLRRELGDAAYRKSLDYTWTKVGALRYERLKALAENG